jgi:hypothetical protein
MGSWVQSFYLDLTNFKDSYDLFENDKKASSNVITDQGIKENQIVDNSKSTAVEESLAQILSPSAPLGVDKSKSTASLAQILSSSVVPLGSPDGQALTSDSTHLSAKISQVPLNATISATTAPPIT